MRAFALAVALAVTGVSAPASAAIYVFEANLSGPAEAPPNASPGTGLATITFDNVAHTLLVEAEFTDLIGTTAAAHIHAPTPTAGTGLAGVATQTPSFSGFPLGVTSGTYNHLFDTTLTSTFNAPFVTANGGTAAGAEAALLAAALDGKAYFNIHTSSFQGGEIRGFLALVPEPATWAMMILGFGMAGSAIRARRRTEIKVSV